MSPYPNLPSLYELAGEYVALMHKLADAEFDEQTIADTIESVGILDDINAKAQGIEMVARSFLSTEEAIDGEIARLRELKQRRRRNADRLREYLKTEMEHMAIQKIECPLFTFALRKNPPSVGEVDERQLPDEYWRVPPVPAPEPNKVLILAELKAGKDVPGAALKPASNRLAIT